AEVIDQRYIKLRFERAARGFCNAPGANRHLGCKGLDDTAISEARADNAADAAAHSGSGDAALPAEGLERPGKILVRPQPQRERASGCASACCHTPHRSKQFEVGLLVGLGCEQSAVDTKSFDGERLGRYRFLGQDVTAACV